MSLTTIDLPAAADLIEPSRIVVQTDYPGATVRLDLMHPSRSAITLIQAGATVFIAGAD